MSRFMLSKSDFLESVENVLNGCYLKTPRAKKIINEIINQFPERVSESFIAKNLNISKRQFQRECITAFNLTYKKLITIIRIHCALILFQNTNMDNFEIALALKYTEESNMARDFRKTLQMSPSDAKVMLSFLNPEEITANIIKNS